MIPGTYSALIPPSIEDINAALIVTVAVSVGASGIWHPYL
jgi:hypothetical protein